MTKFNKADFHYHGDYLTYQGKFVARFKHVPSNGDSFVTFICKNFTVEEYMNGLAAGRTPVGLATDKGYIPAHIKKWLRDGVLKEWKPQHIN